MRIEVTAYSLIFLTANLLLAFTIEQREDILNDYNVDQVLDKTCSLNPEDTERSEFMELTSKDQEKEILDKSSKDFSLLTMEEKETLLKLSNKDFDSVKTCEDHHEMFNETVFSELNLFYILESEGGPQLVRNFTSFAILGLEPNKVKCKYSLVKSDADSDVDDSQYDIPLGETAINLESPHNTVGVVCTAPVDDLRHIIDPDMVEFVVDCGTHTAVNCSQCSSEKSGCKGQCVWMAEHCADIQPGQIGDLNLKEENKNKNESDDLKQENEFDELKQENDFVELKQENEFVKLEQENELAELKQEKELAELKREKELAELIQEIEIQYKFAELKQEKELAELKQQRELVELIQEIEFEELKEENKFADLKQENVFTEESKELVNCGAHKAVSCSECGSHRTRCNGECVWVDDHCAEPNQDEFEDELKELVNCGAHKAVSCLKCGSDRTRCNGECVWMDDHCAEPKKVPVNCGAHKADSCYECGSHRTRCNGECVWLEDHCVHRDFRKPKKQFKTGSKEMVEFYSDVLMFVYKSNASLVDCGGHRAVNCSQCSLEPKQVLVNCGAHKAASCYECGSHRWRCNGECVWMEDHCAHPDLKKRGCNGQCVWRDNHCVERGAGNVPAYSVLVLCLDATSRFSFSRNLPKTLKYLKDSGGIVFNKHHRQGENTYPNFLALLSGALDFKGEFKGTMNDITEQHKLNWAWEDWRNAGLPNIYHEDMPQFGPFNSYGRKGWENRSPFMHIHRSAFHAMDSDKFNIRNGALDYGYQCMGNTPSYKRQLALMKTFTRTYENTSSFGVFMFSEYTHDTTNLVRVMDEDILTTLTDLIAGGYTKRTLVIVMGDHGKRYGIPGKAGWLDANSPMMLLLIPEAMKEEMPGLMDVVLENSRKMTTMQDIYKTITDPIITGKEPEGDAGGLSLLHPIPSRMCEEASVPQMFCMCRQEKLNATDPTLIEHTNEILREINQKVENYSQCHPLRLHHVEWAWRDAGVYHIQLFAQKLEPDLADQSLFTFHAVFEEREPSDILRTDFYSKTSNCIQDTKLQKIKPFCICRSQ